MYRAILFCVVVLLSTVGTLADPPRQFGPNNNGFDFFGLGGAIVLWTIDGAHWVKIKFMKLQEIDAAGNVVAQAFNFDNFGFEWQVVNPNFAGWNAAWNANFTEVKLTDNNLVVTNLQSLQQQQVQFQVDTFIFRNNVNMTFAGEKIVAKAGQLKWQVSINGFQTQNAANKIRFGVQLLSDSFANNTAYNTLDPVPATVSSLAIAFGKGELIVPRVALVNNKATNITATILYEAGQLEVQWDFPGQTAAGQTILYDPVAATTDLIVSTTSAALAKSVSGFVLSVSLALLAVFSAMLTL
jgi:hypothetical protein